MQDFTRTLTTVMPQLSADDQSTIQQKYERPGDRDSFDLHSFQSDLMQIVSLSSSKTPTLDTATKQLYQQVLQGLKTGEVTTAFVINLKGRDTLQKGYLNEVMISQSFEDTS